MTGRPEPERRTGSGRVDPAAVRALGLVQGVRGCLFDLDGVVTKTAKVHAAAWKEMFDEFLTSSAERAGKPFVPFDPVEDYDRYVDGKQRADGTRSFLESRGIELPEGGPDDDPGSETVNGLGNRKNAIVLRAHRRGRGRGLRGLGDLSPGRPGCWSAPRRRLLQRQLPGGPGRPPASRTCSSARVDGVTAQREHLAGKPAPDMFVAGAQALQRSRPTVSRLRGRPRRRRSRSGRRLPPGRRRGPRGPGSRPSRARRRRRRL